MPDIYEIVNATQLDSDLEDIADAIRAKSQGQDPLLFPSEFISEIGSIPTGASITGQTDVTVKALENIAQGDTLYIYKPMQAMFVDTLAGDCHNAAWKPDGTRLAIAHGKSPRITIYDTTTTPYTKISNPDTLPAGNANGCSWSPDGKRLAVAHSTSPYMTVYNTEATPYTKLTNPASLPTGTGNDCAWSADGERLAIGHASSRYLSIYNTTTSPYTRLTTGAMPTAVHQLQFYGSGHRYVAVSLYGGRNATIYDIDNNTVSYFKFGPFSLGYGCAFSPDFKKIAIASYESLMNMYIYEYSETEAEKASNLASYSMGGSYGYAKSSIASGSTGAAAILFEP